MKTFKIFSMAAVALCLAACSNSDDYSVQMPTQSADVLHFEAAVAAPNADATMRTVYTVDDTNIKVAWKDGDKIAAIVTNSEGKYAKTDLTVSKVNTDGSATISGDITKPKDDALTVDLIYPASIVTIDDHGILSVSFEKMRNGSTLDGTLESIANNIDYRRADACPLTVSGDKATLTSAAKLESKLSIWKLTLQDKDGNALSASKVAIVSSGGVAVASATLATAGSTAYLPVPAATGDICISATTADNDYFYMKEGVALAAKKYYRSTVRMTKGAHLAFLSADYEAKDGETLTGALAADATTKIKIADNATVTLKDVTINGTNVDDIAHKHAGITCDGDATINLEGTNTVKGFHEKSPGISVPDGKTLTIQGTGSLTASSNGKGAGIGGGYATSCGNITISGGTVIATGGYGCAGIGGGYMSYSCGNITISGGTVNATGGELAAGIGSGYWNDVSGTINITSGVTKVTATKGTNAPNSIGKGDSSPDISVTIGGTVYASGISESPYEYPLPALSLTSPAVGQVIGSDGKNYAADATLPTGVTKVAMIAYVSGSNGLAIQLNGSPVSKNWADAKTYAAGLTAFTGGTWRLPSKTDWQNMFVGCAVSGDAGASDNMSPIAGFKAKIAATGITWQSGNYWSSTEGGPGAWLVGVNLGDSNALATFIGGPTSSERKVLACLAF